MPVRRSCVLSCKTLKGSQKGVIAASPEPTFLFAQADCSTGAAPRFWPNFRPNEHSLNEAIMAGNKPACP